MSFPIVLMYNNEPMEKISKNPQQITSVTGVLRDNSSIMDPEFLVELEDPGNVNYAYIGPFRRFYYITDIVAYRNEIKDGVMHRLWKMKLHTDVLKTFSEGILGSPCIIAKTGGNDFNLYLPDGNFKRQQNDRYGMVMFPSGFDVENDGRYYLTFFG